MNRLIILKILSILPAIIGAQSYNWPIPDDVNRWINGTFCECRASGSVSRHHFHDGVDIHLPQGKVVYSVITGTVTSIGTAAEYGINSWIRVGRYAYVHVDANPTLAVGDSVHAFMTVIGTTNSWNHIHFKDGYPGSERNPVRLGEGLTPIEDIYPPSVQAIEIYPFDSDQAFLEGRVFGKIDIVAHAADRTDSGPISNNNGIYSIGYHVLDANGVAIAGQIPFKFDIIPASDSYTPIVFAPGSNTSAYFYEVTNTISQDRYLDVSGWIPGIYTLQVFTHDPYGLSHMSQTEFEVMEMDTIAPSAPVLLAVWNTTEGLEISWLPVNEPDVSEYCLYFSFDGIQWNQYRKTILTPDMTALTIPTGTITGQIFFHLTAVDRAPYPNESKPSDSYGIDPSIDLPKVLLVDSFHRTDGGWSKKHHEIMIEIGSRLGTAYETVTDDFFQFQELDFAVYDAVIVHDGDDLSPPNSAFTFEYLTSDPASRVRWYIGTRILEVWPTTQPEWRGELPTSSGGLVPLPDRLLWQGDTAIELDPSQGLWQPDSLFPIDENHLETWIVDSTGRMYGGSDGNGKIIFTLPFETVGAASLLDTIITSFHKLLHSFQEQNNPILVNKYFIHAYPNPFHSGSSLEITLPMKGDIDMVIYDLLGHEIWSDVVPVRSGLSQITLPEYPFQRAGSGVYFVRTVYPAKGRPQATHVVKLTYIK
ncbi:T9SS type A sorting domain-containing protein [Candidatus Neomarinimicrobiota bacterium]